MASQPAKRTSLRNPLAAVSQLLLLGSGPLVMMMAVLCGTNALAQTTRRPAKRNKSAMPVAERRTKERSDKALPAARNTKPDIMAVVNHQPITGQQLARECIRRFGESVLESEVNKRLILAACQEQGVRVTPTEVNAEVERMAGKFGVSTDGWLQMLQKERQISPTQYKRDIVWPMLCLRKLAANQLEVTPKEMEQAYESEYGRMVQVRMLTSRSRERAEALRRKALANPAQFDGLAKDYSEDEHSAAARGLIPPVRRHVGDSKIERVVFALQPDEISRVVEVSGQFYVFKCEHHIPARELTAEQRQQVTEQLRDVISDRKLREVATRVFKNLQSRAKIVNVINNEKLRRQMPTVAALVDDRPITMSNLGQQCILRYGEDVLQGEIDRVLLTQALKRRSLQVKQAQIESEIARAADAFGFVKEDGTPDVQRWLKHVTTESKVSVDTYVRDVVWPSVALKQLVGSTVEVTDEDLGKGFEANYGERVEVLAIVLSNQRTAHEVFDLARRKPTDKFFGELAHQYSIEPVSRANFGQVPPVRKWGGQPLIEQEAFRLEPGELSGVLSSGGKFIILRCLGRTKPVVQQLSAVQEELQQDIREKKMRLAMQAEFERLRTSAQIDNFFKRSVQPGTAQVQQASFQK